MRKEIKYSVVIPVYNEEGSLDELGQRLVKVLNGLPGDWEIIFIDDGSTDNSFEKIKRLVQKDSRIKGVKFRRNSGKSAAYSWGFQLARGDILFTLDADLQDRPEEIPKFVKKLREEYDAVFGWKAKRYDPRGVVIASRIFNFTVSFLTGVKLHDFNCGLRAFKKEVVSGIKLYGGLYRFIPFLITDKGFKITEIKVSHAPRRHGKSKYGIAKFSRGFFDLFTAIFLLQFLEQPLHLFGAIGAAFLVVGFIINVYLTILWFSGESIGERPLLILGVLLVIVGLQFASTGLIGEMITHFQTKTEADYPISEKVGKFN
jgi:glycosyltransferase involved in cell wall biosynthesis